jgi:hypothetical protein
MSSSMDFFGPTPVDRSVTTGSVATGSVTDSISDELSKLGASPLHWANSSTGSAGVIRDVAESRDGAVLCRDFSTTRHSYEGIAQFSGKTCLIGNGQWQLMMFRKQG